MHPIRSAVRAFLCTGLLLACCLPAIVRADDAPAAPAGIRGEMIANINDAGSKVQELAGAVPEAKYSWAPAKGVRTMGQVYLHIVAANYMFPGVMGVKGGMSMEEGMQLDKKAQSKEKTLQLLKESYAFLTNAIAGMSDADLEAPVEFFGSKMTKRAMLLVALGHSHEHLGQSIAYARSMGVTPPWTARENAAAKKMQDEKAMKK